MPPVARRPLALLLSALCLLFGAAGARADVYWVNNDTSTIGRAANAGSGVNTSFVSGGGTLGGGVASDGRHLYWSLWWGGIARANLDGSGVDTAFLATPGQAGSLATDGVHIYWSVPNDTRIGRARVDGSDVDPDFVVLDDGGSPDGVAVDGASVYWTDNQLGRVGRVNVDGSGANPDWIQGADGPTHLTVSGGWVYWANSGQSSIGRMRTDGGGLNWNWVTTSSVPNGIAADARYVYWSEPAANRIGRVTTAGSGADANFIGGVDWPQGLLVTAPGFSAAPAAPAFGSVVVGRTAEQTITVTNDVPAWAGQPLTFGSGAVTLSGTNANQFSISADSCSGQSLAPGATCSVTIAFAPTTTGSKTAAVRFADDAAGSPQSVTVTGRGTQAAVSVVPVTDGDFGDRRVGTSSGYKGFVFNNVASADAAATTIAAGGVTLTGADPGEFSIVLDNCSGRTIAPGSACLVRVVFAPTADGAASATLAFADDAPGSPHTTALTGTGVTPSLSLDPPTHDFGSVLVGASAAPATVTVSNDGTGPATLPAGAATLAGVGAAAFAISDDDCSGATLAAGAECTVVVAFTPSSTGAAAATLELSGDGAALSTALSGTGVAPLLSLLPDAHDFGAVLLGERAAAASFTVANEGSGPATLPAGAVVLGGAGASAFAVTDDDCSGAELAAGEECTVAVVFAPSAVGAATATLEVADGDGGSLSAALSGTGTEPARPGPDPGPDPNPRTGGDGAPPTRYPPTPNPPTPARRAPSSRTPSRRATPRPRLTASVGSGPAAVVGADGTLRLRCVLAGAALRGCAAVVTSADGGAPLGSGSARPRGGGGSATAAVRLGARGRAALARSLGGVRAVVTVTATTRDGRRVVRRLRVTLLARRQQVVTLPGAFAPDGAALTPAGAAFLRTVARDLRGARAIVCTGFTATRGEQGSDAAADALGLARGRAACALLRRLGVAARLTARSGGRSEPLAGNDDEAGRARNRRVELAIAR